MKHRIIKQLFTALNLIVFTGMIGLSGCATSSQNSEAAETIHTKQPGAQNVATVVKANKELGYVILETSIAPKVGQEAVIKRRGKDVGTVKITDDQSMPFVAADVISGNVFVGDAVLLVPAEGGE